jgi:CheY-like chemotaxis protein
MLHVRLDACGKKSRRQMANPMRVLVVEDDQPIQSLLEEALAEGGFEASIASSGEEALTLLKDGKYDLPGA